MEITITCKVGLQIPFGIQCLNENYSFRPYLRQAQILILEILNVFLRLKSRQARLDAPGTLHHVIDQAKWEVKYQFTDRERAEKIKQHIIDLCRKEGGNIEELRSGSRRPKVCSIRHQLAMELVDVYGAALAEIARHVGVSTSAVSKALSRAVRR